MEGVGKGSARGHLALALSLAASAAALLAACYDPDFSKAIFVCDVYSCPMGQVCNSDKICVQFPVEGCTNGGITAAGDVYLCPGPSNACAPTYGACKNPPTDVACAPVAGADLAGARPCQLCCRQ